MASETRAGSGLFGNRSDMHAINRNEVRAASEILENKSDMPDLQKSQEVLRKLQEMKEKLMAEAQPQMKEKLMTEAQPQKKEKLMVEIQPQAQQNTKMQERPQEEVQYPVEEEKTIEVAEDVANYTYNEDSTTKTEFVSESVIAPENINTSNNETLIASEELPQAVNEMQESEELPQAVREMQENPNIIEDIVNSKIEEKPADFEEMYLKLFGTRPVQENAQEEKTNETENAQDIATLGNTSMFDDIEEYQKPTYKFIGIVFNTYIIVEIDKEMYIIDQHAAHERILYEKVKANYYNDDAKDSQLMLLPDIITLSHKEMEIAKDNMQMFQKAGFMLEEFGENTLKLTGVPEMCLDLETKELFLETLDEINSVSRTAKQEIEERFIATVACKAAVKANMALTKEEVDSLMDKLLALPNPFTCPHGRPTAIKMSKYDIEKKFARV